MDDLMQEAWNLTNGDRRDAYGDPKEVFDAYGAIWTSILGPKLRPGCTVDAADATLMMAGLKLCREAHKIKRDNVVDCHGYLSLHSKVTGLLATLPPVCTCTHTRSQGKLCEFCRHAAATEKIYACDACRWCNHVRGTTHGPRACPQTNCRGTQWPQDVCSHGTAGCRNGGACAGDCRL